MNVTGAIASHTRSAVIGSCCTWCPISFAIALPIAAAVVTFGASARPLEPCGPPSGAGLSTQAIRIGGASMIVCSLYSSSIALRCRPASS